MKERGEGTHRQEPGRTKVIEQALRCVRLSPVFRLFELGLLTIYSGLHGNVVEITPPLTIGAGDVDEALSIFEQALADVEAGNFDDAKLTPFAGW